MLSVGRELKIHDKVVICRSCSWRGVGAELSAGLIQVTSTPMFFYAYRCPACLSFDIARRGKLLPFRIRPTIALADEHGTQAAAQHANVLIRLNRK
jgi:hypothetical protein